MKSRVLRGQLTAADNDHKLHADTSCAGVDLSVTALATQTIVCIQATHYQSITAQGRSLEPKMKDLHLAFP